MGVGTFTGTSYSVTNRSQSKVAVSVANFTEENKHGGITILPTNQKDTIDGKGRDNVIMALIGDNDQYIDLGNFDKTTDPTKELLEVDKNNGVGTIRLAGVAGKGNITSANNGINNDTGVSETFKLVFQIKKKG